MIQTKDETENILSDINMYDQDQDNAQELASMEAMAEQPMFGGQETAMGEPQQPSFN